MEPTQVPRQPKKTWLIVGASRGIGREFVRQLLQNGDQVLATVRDVLSSQFEFPTEEKQLLGHLTVFNCDMLSEQSIDTFVGDLISTHGTGLHIDHVVLNAGVLKYPNRASEISYSDFALHLHTNTIGPLICAQRLLKAKPQLSIGNIVFMSSDSGSAQQFRAMEDGFAAYAASKAALNQGLRHLAEELRRKGDRTIVIALHPGEVQTDMADVELPWEVEGQLTVEQSVTACRRTIEGKGEKDSGTFWTWEDEVYPW